MPSTAGLSTAIADAVKSVHPAAAIVVLDGSPRLALTVSEVTELLGVNRKNVYRWIETGELRVLSLSGPTSGNRHYRISVTSVLDLVNGTSEHG